jgi:large subunit ribosomal protein L21
MRIERIERQKISFQDSFLQDRPFQDSVFLTNKGFQVVYAVVRAGGRQEKVEVGTIVVLDRIKADENGNVSLAPVLLVDGDTITSGASALADVKVTAEVVGDLRGPKIVIQKFKNKTGYKKRQGHRQELTRIKITSITK